MSMWEEAIESSTFEFIEKLERRGFRVDGRTLTGNIGLGDDSVRVNISIPEGFPFAPPRVSPPSDFPRSWHRELNGEMCLYPSEGRQNLPWLDVNDFLALVERWIVESRAGWPGDFPDLELERYFEHAADPLVVYGDLDELNGKFVMFRRDGQVMRLVGLGSIPKNRRAGGGRSFGYVTDIGEPAVPPANWADLTTRIPESEVRQIESAVSEGRVQNLVVRYTRGGVDAAIVLSVWRDKTGALKLRALRAASEAPATLALRGGVHANALAGARVAVVGVGAIGSFVCDLLSRSGVGVITAYDPDIVKPGNLVRHLAGGDTVGSGKPDAVKRIIEPRKYSPTKVVTKPGGLPTPREVLGIFVDHELVIDASASGDVTPALVAAARLGGFHLLTVCIQEEGCVVRVDITPPLQGDPIEETSLSLRVSRDELRFEAGCGDPVSQTPPFAVYEAAALAVRHAIGLLTGAPVSAAGTVRDYR